MYGTPRCHLARSPLAHTNSNQVVAQYQGAIRPPPRLLRVRSNLGRTLALASTNTRQARCEKSRINCNEFGRHCFTCKCGALLISIIPSRLFSVEASQFWPQDRNVDPSSNNHDERIVTRSPNTMMCLPYQASLAMRSQMPVRSLVAITSLSRGASIVGSQPMPGKWQRPDPGTPK